MIRLHGSPDSANFVVRMALEVFELPYSDVRVHRGRQEHKLESYLRLNPQGLLPVLEDGEIVLFETGAILLHLCERVGRFGPAIPAFEDAAVRSRVLKWLFYLSNTPHADLRAAFYSHRYVGDPATIPSFRSGMTLRFANHLHLLEGVLGRQGEGIVGPLSVLDFYLAALIRWAQLYPIEQVVLKDLAPWPKLYALLRSLEEQPFVLRACASECISDDQPFTQPQVPSLPVEDVNG